MSLNSEDRKTLLRVARDAIEYGLEHAGHEQMPVSPHEYSETLNRQLASFVTLQMGGQLRGCIGTLEAHRALVIDVAQNAHAAAFSDPRFSPLTAGEYQNLEIHISILSPAQPMSFENEEDLIQQLRPGIDGLILEDGFYRGTFLPSVWESLPHPEVFFNHLKQKAGLSLNYWSESLQVRRYTTESFGEEDA